jgi:hypothetical protein
MKDLMVGPNIVLYDLCLEFSFCFFKRERASERVALINAFTQSVSFLENVRGVGLNNPLSKQLLHENHS